MKVVNTSGKRKKAVARATVKAGAGRVRVNNQPVEIYQPSLAREKIMEPLALAPNRAEKVDIDVAVNGGGIFGQAEAVRTAIARGIVEFFNDDKLKELYLGHDRSLLVNDPRRKEAKHPLGRGARKHWQKSYR
ncbi:MAG: 30S ribosomal protein S9 [Euryarchaeota archaeon]|nr:30S ribosomal protein S9 [Euryarchaeota archaeon]